MAEDASYRERLWLPWWAWPLGLGVAVAAATELAVGAPAIRHPLLYAATLCLATLALAALCRTKISIQNGILHVDDARLETEFIASASEVDPETRRGLLGPDADPLAFVIQRPWIKTAVRVDLNDPADPTPYWLISTRKPAQLVAALVAAGRAGANPQRAAGAGTDRDLRGLPGPGAASPGG